MSTLPGNPYAETLEPYLDPRNGIEALATLALAYEQRTASLIAYWNALAGDAEPWQDTPFQRELDDMHRDIRTRLGRTAEVPK